MNAGAIHWLREQRKRIMCCWGVVGDSYGDLDFNLEHIGLQGLPAFEDRLDITSVKLRGEMRLDTHV